MLNIKSKTSGPTTTIVMDGRLDGVTTPQAQELLDGLLKEEETKNFLFDLGGLTYMSSMGLRLLMRATKEIHHRQGRCLLSNLQPPVQTILDMAQYLPTENIFSSYEEADAYLNKILEDRGITEGPANTKVVELNIKG